MVPNGTPEMNSSTSGLLGSFLNSTNSNTITSSGSGVRTKPAPMLTIVNRGSRVTLIVPFATGEPDSSIL